MSGRGGFPGFPSPELARRAKCRPRYTWRQAFWADHPMPSSALVLVPLAPQAPISYRLLKRPAVMRANAHADVPPCCCHPGSAISRAFKHTCAPQGGAPFFSFRHWRVLLCSLLAVIDGGAHPDVTCFGHCSRHAGTPPPPLAGVFLVPTCCGKQLSWCWIGIPVRLKPGPVAHTLEPGIASPRCGATCVTFISIVTCPLRGR